MYVCYISHLFFRKVDLRLDFVFIKFEASEMKRKNFTMAHVFGSAMPMSLLMEQELVSHPLRLPGLQSSNLGLEVLQDGLVNFEFKDYLNRMQNDSFFFPFLNNCRDCHQYSHVHLLCHHFLTEPELSDMPDIDMHAQMQSKLGIQVKLQF